MQRCTAERSGDVYRDSGRNTTATEADDDLPEVSLPSLPPRDYEPDTTAIETDGLVDRPPPLPPRDHEDRLHPEAVEESNDHRVLGGEQDGADRETDTVRSAVDKGGRSG